MYKHEYKCRNYVKFLGEKFNINNYYLLLKHL